MGVNIPLGVESFARMRENDYYYIDKTNFIKELMNTKFIANLITRPRRFGKSLTMSMLEDFFDISKNSRSHFVGLAISKETEICEKWMNQYPVIFISLKDIGGNTFDEAYGMLKLLISNLCLKYEFLEKSENINSINKRTLIELQSQTAAPENLKGSLLLLTRMLSVHYGKKTILLVDEYDVPLAKANDNGYYREMLEVIRALLSTALKTNDFLEFGIVTGCLRISKESIFTGLNNLVINSITTERFDECIGFTETEVQKLLSDTGFTDHAKEVKTIDRKELIQAFWNGDAVKASELVSDILFNTISYYDYKESFYHAFVAGLMIGAGYIVESNYEKGLGRPDIVVMDRKKRRVILMEAKHASDGESIEHACKEALKQIKEKRYAQSLKGFRTLICYGIAFEGKDCLIQQLFAF